MNVTTRASSSSASAMSGCRSRCAGRAFRDDRLRHRSAASPSSPAATTAPARWTERLAGSGLEVTDDTDGRAAPTSISSPCRPRWTRPTGPIFRRCSAATETVAGLIDGAGAPIIIYESTVYPGVTEDLCGPLIERVSGLKRGRDFFLAYSPERINPGDREHTRRPDHQGHLRRECRGREQLAAIYGAVTSGGVFRPPRSRPPRPRR